MKRWKYIIFVIALGSYIGIAFEEKFAAIHWINPMVATLVEIHSQQVRGNIVTDQDIKHLIAKTSYSYARWPYNAYVDGTGTSWTLHFEPVARTWWRRLWWTIAYWQPNPIVPHSYERSAGSPRVKCTKSDGSIFYVDEW